MTIYNVLSKLTVGADTALVIEGPRELLKNGIGVLDENGKPFEVLSIGMDNLISFDNALNRTSLLISGKFESKNYFYNIVLVNYSAPKDKLPTTQSALFGVRYFFYPRFLVFLLKVS